MADLITKIGNRHCQFEFGHDDNGTEFYTFARVTALAEGGESKRTEKPILAYASDPVEALAICADTIKQRNDADHSAQN